MPAVRFALAALVLLIVAAAPADAQSAASGFFAGVRTGATWFETPTVRDREGPGLLGYDRSSMTWSVFGGHEWQVSRPVSLGIEIGYTDNGQATITYASANAYAFSSSQLEVLGSVAASYQRVTLAIKAGIGRTRESYQISTYVSGTPDLNSERARDLPVLAFSVAYALSGRVAILLDARRTMGDVANTVTKALISSNPTPPPYRDVLNSVSRVTAVSVGVKVRF